MTQIRRYFSLAAAIAVLPLAGCATTNGTPPSPIITQIQNIAVASCGFLPTIDTVANILALGNPLLLTAEAVADAVCKAVTAVKPASPRMSPLPTVPNVKGVPVEGTWKKTS